MEWKEGGKIIEGRKEGRLLKEGRREGMSLKDERKVIEERKEGY